MPRLQTQLTELTFPVPTFPRREETYRFAYRALQVERLGTSTSPEEICVSYAVLSFGPVDPDSTVLAGEVGVGTYASIFEKIDDVVNDPEMYEEGEERPDSSVIKNVKHIIQGTRVYNNRIDRIDSSNQLPEPVVRPLDGALRVSWGTNKGDVTLVLSNRESYIFNEELVNGEPRNADLTRRVTKSSLSKKLEWLISK